MSKSALGVRGTVRPVPPVLPFPRVPFARLRGSFLHEPLALSRLFHSHQQLLYQLEHRWSSLQIQNEHVHKSYCRCFYGWQMSSVGRGIPTRTTKLLMKQKTCDMQSAPVILLRDSPSSQSKHKIKYAATLVGVIFCHRLRIFFNDTINASLMKLPWLILRKSAPVWDFPSLHQNKPTPPRYVWDVWVFFLLAIVCVFFHYRQCVSNACAGILLCASNRREAANPLLLWDCLYSRRFHAFKYKTLDVD